MPKLLFLIAEDSYFYSHRLNLAKAALKNGFKVAIATRCQNHQHLIEAAGIEVFPLRYFNRSGINPWQQLCLLYELFVIYKHYKPDIVHQVAIKPVILGSLVAKICNISKIINALGGLGFVFTQGKKPATLYARIKKRAFRFFTLATFRWIFSQSNTYLILQNDDDCKTLLQSNCVKPSSIHLIPGAGVDIKAFPELPFPTSTPIIITCISRMLWNKGIGELVTAAKILHEKKIPATVILYGMPDPENPASIDLKTLTEWNNSGLIEWRGYCSNVVEAYAQCHIAVLPSYREGLPKSLLEAASCGRPIVTTDVAGCREVVEHNETGILVPPMNSPRLADALITLCQDKNLRARMGAAGRKRVKHYFVDTIIHGKTLTLYR
jgi:glycosyltransferase involved in cell wall biosynthesis